MTASALAGRRVDPVAALARRHRAVMVVGMAIGLHALLFGVVRTATGAGAALPAGLRPAVSVRTIRLEPEPLVERTALQAAPVAPASPAAPQAADRTLAQISAAPSADKTPHARLAATADATRPPSAGRIDPPPDPVRAPDRPPAPSTEAPAAPVTGLPPAPDYLPRTGLDVPPRPLGEIDPLYPDAAQLRSGSVVLRLLIDERGDVADAAVVRSFPKALFDASALRAFASAKFAPGERGGVAVKSQLTVEVEFTPMNRGAAVSGRSY